MHRSTNHPPVTIAAFALVSVGMICACPADLPAPGETSFSCHNDGDCSADYRCSDGVCVPAGEVTPRDGGELDRRMVDVATTGDSHGLADHESTMDIGPEADVAIFSDAHVPDVAIAADTALADVALADTEYPDATSPDTASPDAALPDSTTTPDAPAADTSSATTDAAAPDSLSVTDASAPDIWAPDTATCGGSSAVQDVFAVTAVADDALQRISVAWSNPTECPPESIIVRRALGAPPAGPGDGAAVTTGMTSFEDSAVSAGALYCYKIFAQRPGMASSAGVAVCALLGVPAAQPAPVPDGVIVVDGLDSDAAWSQAPRVELSFAQRFDESGGVDPEITGYVRLAYDSDRLYLFLQVDDKFVHLDPEDYSWFDDGVELFFDMNFDREDDTDPNPDDFHLIYTADNTRAYEGQGDDLDYDGSWSPATEVVTVIDGTASDESDIDTGWSLELSIPFADLGTPAITPGRTIGFEFWINEDDTQDHQQQHWYTWTPGSHSRNSATWGLCTF